MFKVITFVFLILYSTCSFTQSGSTYETYKLGETLFFFDNWVLNFEDQGQEKPNVNLRTWSVKDGSVFALVCNPNTGTKYIYVNFGENRNPDSNKISFATRGRETYETEIIHGAHVISNERDRDSFNGIIEYLSLMGGLGGFRFFVDNGMHRSYFYFSGLWEASREFRDACKVLEE